MNLDSPLGDASPRPHSGETSPDPHGQSAGGSTLKSDPSPGQHPSGDISKASADAASTSVSPKASADVASTSGSSSASRRGDRDPNSKAKREQRERKAEDNKKWQEEVRLALWPTPELDRRIRDKCLVSKIDYGRLNSSYRFRDQWFTFKKLRAPSSKDVEGLRTLAIRILSQPMGKANRGGATTKASNKGEIDTENTVQSQTNITEKRKRDPSTSSTGSDQKPTFKIPKKTASAPEALASAADDAANTDSMDTEAEADVDLVETEGDYGPLDAFTPDIADALPGDDYASAAKGKKKPRLEYPFLLYVHKGKDLRERIPKQVWTLFKEKFNERLIEDTLEDKPTPDIDWTGFKDGTGVVAALDQTSRDLAEAIIEQIEVAEMTFKGWPKGVQDKQMTVTIKVPPEFKNIASGKLCEALAKKNGLHESGVWDLYSVKTINKDCGERILRIRVDDVQLDALKARSGRLMVGSRKLEVFLANNRIS